MVVSITNRITAKFCAALGFLNCPAIFSKVVEFITREVQAAQLSDVSPSPCLYATGAIGALGLPDFPFDQVPLALPLPSFSSLTGTGPLLWGPFLAAPHWPLGTRMCSLRATLRWSPVLSMADPSHRSNRPAPMRLRMPTGTVGWRGCST